MSVLSLVRQFESWAQNHDHMVLATVFQTRGHTYSKAGAQMLIAGTQYQGMVSGGCLEGDISLHAEKVLQTGVPKVVHYDLRSTPENELIGLGVGCEGEISLLLQRLAKDRDFEPFSQMAAARLGQDTLGVLVVLESADDTEPGTSLFFDGQGERLSGLTALPSVKNWSSEWAPNTMVTLESATCLAMRHAPLPRFLLLGAGLDALPLAELATNTGWLVTVSDNRSGLLQGMEHLGIEQTVLCQANQLTVETQLDRYQAVVIMSHHLEKDRLYLKQCLDSSIPYVGLLGPVSRGQRLLQEIGVDAATVAHRLRSPVGLDIGSDSPETIALAIMAEVHAVTANRAGSFLTHAR